MQLILSVLSLLLAPVAITACEGDCIIDITNQYLQRYEDVLLTTFQKLESASQFIIFASQTYHDDTHRRVRSASKSSPLQAVERTPSCTSPPS